MVPCPICKEGSYDTLSGMISHINDVHYKSDAPVDLEYKRTQQQARFKEMVAKGISIPTTLASDLCGVQQMSSTLGYKGNCEIDAPLIFAPLPPEPFNDSDTEYNKTWKG